MTAITTTAATAATASTTGIAASDWRRQAAKALKSWALGDHYGHKFALTALNCAVCNGDLEPIQYLQRIAARQSKSRRRTVVSTCARSTMAIIDAVLFGYQEIGKKNLTVAYDALSVASDATTVDDIRAAAKREGFDNRRKAVRDMWQGKLGYRRLGKPASDAEKIDRAVRTLAALIANGKITQEAAESQLADEVARRLEKLGK